MLCWRSKFRWRRFFRIVNGSESCNRIGLLFGQGIAAGLALPGSENYLNASMGGLLALKQLNRHLGLFTASFANSLDLLLKVFRLLVTKEEWWLFLNEQLCLQLGMSKNA
jgi:hypothetical protein